MTVGDARQRNVTSDLAHALQRPRGDRCNDRVEPIRSTRQQEALMRRVGIALEAFPGDSLLERVELALAARDPYRLGRDAAARRRRALELITAAGAEVSR